jgi:cell division protein FtsA
MQLNEPYLIIDLNDNRAIFFVISFNEKKDFKILKKIILEISGIQNGRIVNIETVSQLLKKTINSIEDEINFFFSNAAIIINPNQINCLNVSGYKKLNGSQVSSDDIAYILNDIKKIILEGENNDCLVHLFNSNFSLDSDNLENLPIGLFGEFYNQNMTFFLVNKNIIKNIKSVFSNCGLNIQKIILRSFAEGIYLLSHNQSDKNFTIFRLEKNKINVSLFRNKSYVFCEDFNFGFNLIIKDISKLCSLKTEEVENFIKEIELRNIIESNNESYLEQKYFYASPYRKIKYQLILDIMKARIEELFELCYKKNSNIKNLKNSDKVYIYVDSPEYYKNIEYVLEDSKLTTLECILNINLEQNFLAGVNGACELIGKGWEKEAIPITYKKKSLISGFFSRLFD